MNMNSSVVRDVAKLAEVVHELAYAGSRRSDHIGKCLLGYRRDHGLRFAWFAKLSHDKQRARETLLAIVE